MRNKITNTGTSQRENKVYQITKNGKIWINSIDNKVVGKDTLKKAKHHVYMMGLYCPDVKWGYKAI